MVHAWPEWERLAVRAAAPAPGIGPSSANARRVALAPPPTSGDNDRVPSARSSAPPSFGRLVGPPGAGVREVVLTVEVRLVGKRVCVLPAAPGGAGRSPSPGQPGG